MGRRLSKASQGKGSKTLSQKQKENRAGSVAKVVRHQPTMCKIVGSIPSTTNKGKKMSGGLNQLNHLSNVIDLMP